MAALPEVETVTLKPPSLVVLCGISGSGKSSFARDTFPTTQIVSSDTCRALLCDDPGDQRVSGRAFELFHWLISQRLELGRLTIADSTALTKRARVDLLNLAQQHSAQAAIFIFDIDLQECVRRDALRDHPVGEAVIAKQYARFQQAKRDVNTEGWENIVIMGEQNDRSSVKRIRIGTFDLRYEHGPFDIVGDVHGCTVELLELVSLLGYKQDVDGRLSHPEGRRLVFVGDLGDRGPYNVEAFALVMRWARGGMAFYTPGNHCNKLMRYLLGRKVTQSHGLALTVSQVEEYEKSAPGFKARLRDFIAGSPTYLWLDGGTLVVAHGGIKQNMLGRDDRTVQLMCLYGDITGKSNPDGTPVRLDWAAQYRGEATVVYGHTPTAKAEWRSNTINIDQGCVFGGRLTALRWPERETVEVKARQAYDSSKTMEQD